MSSMSYFYEKFYVAIKEWSIKDANIFREGTPSLWPIGGREGKLRRAARLSGTIDQGLRGRFSLGGLRSSIFCWEGSGVLLGMGEFPPAPDAHIWAMGTGPTGCPKLNVRSFSPLSW